MKRVMVVANNPAQASFRLRIAALAPLLAERGFHLDIRIRPKGWLAIPKLLALHRLTRDAHAVILQRKLLDPWEASALRRYARKIYFDVDDAVMTHNRAVSGLSRWRTDRRFAATCQIIDCVAAGNDYLAEAFSRQGVATTVIPTMVDARRYPVKRHDPTATPRLVWIGSNSTISYVREMLPALEQAAGQIPGLRLLIIAADQRVSSSVLPIDHQLWTEKGEAAALNAGDIGIAPTPRDEWTRGKCGFKILQYMAAGLPVAASPVGANGQIVRDGLTGLLPRAADDWPTALARLATDAALRAAMGRAGRERVEREFSLDAAADAWAKLLET